MLQARYSAIDRGASGNPRPDALPDRNPDICAMQRPDLPGPELWIAALLFAVGLVIASFAASVLVTYHNGPQFMQLSGLDRLQYDTAWTIGLCGVSLLAYATGARAIARVCATLAILIGGLRIAGYIFPQTVGVHPILANPGLKFGAGDYNAMGVLTALVTVIVATAILFLVPGSKRKPWRTVALALLASTALALSLLIAFGAWSGSIIASQSLLLEGDERTSSLLFILLASTILLYTIMGTEHERRALGRFAPLIVGIAVFICTLVVWGAALNQETRYVRHGTELIASAARAAIERDLHTRIEVLERLAERMSIHPFNADVWQREGASILSDFDEYRSLAWSDSDFVIRWVAPPSNAVGFNIRSDPKRRTAVDLAVTTRAPTLSQFTELVIGGKGVVIYVPVFDGDSYRGMVSGVLGRDDWLRLIIRGRFSDHHFQLLEDGHVQQDVAADSADAADDWTQESPVVRQQRAVGAQRHPDPGICRTRPFAAAASGVGDRHLALGIAGAGDLPVSGGASARA